MDERARERRKWRRVQWIVGVAGAAAIALIVLLPVIREQQVVQHLRLAVAGLDFEIQLAERQEMLGRGYQEGVRGARMATRERVEKAYKRGLRDGLEGCACE